MKKQKIIVFFNIIKNSFLFFTAKLNKKGITEINNIKETSAIIRKII
jgi:hypothetical protein